jgi:hypothetical protein
MTRPDSYQPRAATPPLAIWKGRRGVVNTAGCFVLGLLCAFALWTFTERTTVVPACTAYAAANGMTYATFRADTHKYDSGIVCVLTRADGTPTNVSLRDIVPYLTDQWVGLAMELQLTVPLFTILFALGLVGISKTPANV